MGSAFKLSFAFLLVFAAMGCKDQLDEASNAVGAAKAMMEAADEMKQAGQEMDQAAKAAEEKARAEIPEGASEEEAEQFVAQAKTLAALGAMQKAGGGAITNWRQLQPFLPDALGEYAAEGKLKGQTTHAGVLRVTRVERAYEAGERRAQVNISDAFLAPMMKAPFKMAAMINEDSTEGYRKGTRIAGNAAIVEWREGSKQSKAMILVGERFMVEVEVSPASADDDAVKLANQLELEELAKVEGESEEPVARDEP